MTTDAKRVDGAWKDLLDVIDEPTRLRWRAEILARYPTARKALDKQAKQEAHS